jgi:hypothetical protein
MENKNARKNALAKRSRKLKKESKPSKFEYNPELSEEDNKRIEQLYKENEERNKLIDDMLRLEIVV